MLLFRQPISKLITVFVLAMTPFAPFGQAVANDALQRPIRVTPDGRFLMTSDGKPFFWLGDAAWDLFRRLTTKEAKRYLDDRSRRGFTIIQAAAVFGGYGTPDAMEGRNRNGDQPFIGGRIEQPNPKYFEHIDTIVDEAQARGLRVAMHPIWGALNIGRPDFLTPERARAYGEWLGHRYRGKGMVWVLGGDVSPVTTSDLYKMYDKSAVLVDYRPIWDAMADGIAEGAGDDQFITYHPAPNVVAGAPEPRTSLYFSQRTWLDMNMIQSGHQAEPEDYIDVRRARTFVGSRNYEKISDEYWSSPVRPVVDFEVRFEAAPSCRPKLPHFPCWHERDVRGAAYQALFAGAAGHSYGNYSIWDFHDPDKPREILESGKGRQVSQDWRRALGAPGGDDMRHLKALMLSRSYFERIPDQSLVVTSEGTGDEHIAATRSRAGSYAMIYIPDGRPVIVDLTKIAGPAAVGWWFDPRSGNSTPIDGDLPTNDQRAFTPPSSGTNNDWVLVIDEKAKGFSAPGRVE